jgi:gas vesicle structural protein
MTTAIQPAGGAAGGAAGGPSSSSLADVIDTILDKGLVIDAYVRVSVVGIELLTVDARIVVASVDTYLRFAEAVNRLDISESDPKAGLPEIVGDVMGNVTEGVAKHKTKGALDSAGEKLSNLLSGDEPQRQKSPQRRSRRSSS